MEPESKKTDEDNVQDKQEHIKERLKEMGVSQDSERPKKSGMGKIINLVILAVVAVLVGAYIYEYQSQQESLEKEVATKTDANQNAAAPPAMYGSYQNSPYQNYQGQSQDQAHYNQANNPEVGQQMNNPAMADQSQDGVGQQAYNAYYAQLPRNFYPPSWPQYNYGSRYHSPAQANTEQSDNAAANKSPYNNAPAYNQPYYGYYSPPMPHYYKPYARPVNPNAVNPAYRQQQSAQQAQGRYPVNPYYYGWYR